MGCIALVRCVLVLRCGLAVVVWYPFAVHPQELATNSLSYFMGCIWFDVCWCVVHTSNQIQPMK